MANSESAGPIRYSIEEALLLGGNLTLISSALSRLKNTDNVSAKLQDQQVTSDQEKETSDQEKE